MLVVKLNEKTASWDGGLQKWVAKDYKTRRLLESLTDLDDLPYSTSFRKGGLDKIVRDQMVQAHREFRMGLDAEFEVLLYEDPSPIEEVEGIIH